MSHPATEVRSTRPVPILQFNMRAQKSPFRAENIQDLTGFVVIVTGGKINLPRYTITLLGLTNLVFQGTRVSAMKRPSISPCIMLVSISQVARQNALGQLSKR